MYMRITFIILNGIFFHRKGISFAKKQKTKSLDYYLLSKDHLYSDKGIKY